MIKLDNMCLTCWDRGEIFVEDKKNNNKLFSWPCPHECPAPLTNGLIKIHGVTKGQRKAANAMRALWKGC